MLTSYHCSPVDFKKICQIFDLKFNHNKEVHIVQRYMFDILNFEDIGI